MPSTEMALATIDAKLGQTEQQKFLKVLSGNLNFDSEKHFFGQIVSRSEQLQHAIEQSPQSVVTAMLDLATMGLSLSPALGQAYLVPQRPKRDGPLEVQAIPSYKGLETAVLRDGIATSITTQLVYANDTFQYGTTLDGPVLNFMMALGDRGKLAGGFCLIRLANGDKHVEWMDASALAACEEAALNKAGGKLPPSWRGGFREEMQKKCIVRRAIKHVGLTAMPEKIIESIDRDVGVSDAEVTVTPLIGDAEIRDIRSMLPILSESDQDHWMLRMAQAMGFTSIRDVPADQLDHVKERLRRRMENLQAATTKKSEQKPEPEAKPEVVQEQAKPVAEPAVADARRRRVQPK